MIALLIRLPFLLTLLASGRLLPLLERANFTAIGLSGEITFQDTDIALKRKLRPLSPWELWFLKPYIQAQQEWRRQAFQEAVDDLLTEHPERKWL